MAGCVRLAVFVSLRGRFFPADADDEKEFGMAKVMVRMVFTGIVFLLSAVAFSAQESALQDWTLTRQPKCEGRPLLSGGTGSDFSLMGRERTPLSLGIVAPAQLPWGDWDVCGLRVSLIYGRCDSLTGIDLGLVNGVDGDMIGVQVGLLNTVSRVRGIQVGAMNCTSLLKGVQVGIINYAEGACGLQIGLINIITNTTPGVMPLIYGSF